MHETAILSVKPGSAPPATILIVDDEPEVRTVVAEFLEDFGYRVLQANGGPQALGRLHDDPAVRLLITDIRMPEMSGIELADLATEQNPRLKVSLISGYFVAQQVHRRFLRKPFRMKELESAVRAELGTTC
jgi:CheY-like chemotaxis protein